MWMLMGCIGELDVDVACHFDHACDYKDNLGLRWCILPPSGTCLYAILCCIIVPS